jgi:hypothetical protein
MDHSERVSGIVQRFITTVRAPTLTTHSVPLFRAWIVLPGMITYRLGKDLSAALASSEAINRAAAKAKNK